MAQLENHFHLPRSITQCVLSIANMNKNLIQVLKCFILLNNFISCCFNLAGKDCLFWLHILHLSKEILRSVLTATSCNISICFTAVWRSSAGSITSSAKARQSTVMPVFPKQILTPPRTLFLILIYLMCNLYSDTKKSILILRFTKHFNINYNSRRVCGTRKKTKKWEIVLIDALQSNHTY